MEPSGPQLGNQRERNEYYGFSHIYHKLENTKVYFPGHIRMQKWYTCGTCHMVEVNGCCYRIITVSNKNVLWAHAKHAKQLPHTCHLFCCLDAWGSIKASDTLKRDLLECCYTEQGNTSATQLGCFSHVNFVVINEVRPLANGFLIQDTHKAQSSMNSLVSSEAGAFTKGFLTLVALNMAFLQCELSDGHWSWSFA